MGGRRPCPRSRRLPAGFRCRLEGAGAGTGQAAMGQRPRGRDDPEISRWRAQLPSEHTSLPVLAGLGCCCAGVQSNESHPQSPLHSESVVGGVAVRGTALNAHQPAPKNDFWDLSFPASTIRDHRLCRRGWGSAWPLLFLHSFSSHRGSFSSCSFWSPCQCCGPAVCRAVHSQGEVPAAHGDPTGTPAHGDAGSWGPSLSLPCPQRGHRAHTCNPCPWQRTARVLRSLPRAQGLNCTPDD